MAELTPEEKHKIYLEEKARMEAQEKLKKEFEQKKQKEIQQEREKEEEVERILSTKKAENFKGNLVAIGGTLIMIISFFLTWMKTSKKDYNAFNFATTSHAVILAIICGVIITFALIGWFTNQNRRMGIFTSIAGAVAAAIAWYSIYKIDNLEDSFRPERFIGLFIHDGVGMSICIFGAIVVLAAGIYMALQSTEDLTTDLDEYLT